MDAAVDSFRTAWSLRGISLSVMRNDSLLYARGYGQADGGRPMVPGTLLRMASVSKLITAVGIMKLQERGKLVLDSPVFGPFGILDGYDKYISDDNYYLITVEHLLRHQAGFTQKGGDPMFSTASVMREMHITKAPTQEQLTRHLLARPLAYLPGTSQEYSNFGYLLLSMIIEKLTGEPYETWIRREVLEPAGCYDFHIAGNFYNERYPGETRYHMHKEAKPTNAFDGRGQVERCYGANDIHGLSGAGAWIGSTPELARLVASIDGLDGIPDQISPFSVYQMTQRLSDEIYSLGWVDCTNDGEWTRTGSFSGTSALVKVFPDGECWILITNTSTWKGSRFSRDTGALVKNLRSRFDGLLPQRDLFGE
ncbi:MAG: beta-lactamase family protein [Bacteroidales bacterium]|nr:beta-lactamase family protein [Bacteroidales bacterium]